MSPEAIVSHMNSNFDGTFMLLSSKKIDEPKHKGTEVFMSCTRFPGKTIYIEQIWSHENTFSTWVKSFITDYYKYVYEKDLARYFESRLSELFPENKVFPCAITESSIHGKWHCASSAIQKTNNATEYIQEHKWHPSLIVIKTPSSENFTSQFESFL